MNNANLEIGQLVLVDNPHLGEKPFEAVVQRLWADRVTVIHRDYLRAIAVDVKYVVPLRSKQLELI